MQTLEQAESPAPPVRRIGRGSLMFWGTALAVVGLDQLTKAIVRSSLAVGDSWPADWPVRIKNVTNSGAAFSSLQGATVFLIVMTFFGLAAIYLYYRNPPFQHWAAAIAIGLMLGGAVGNLIDRIRVGRVTDFVDFFGFPTFNVADSSITIGVATIVIGYLLFAEKQIESRAPPEPPHEDAPADG
jgi:signal peptidase II